jgi:DNA-binding transcriptional LysR family regulator
MTLDQLRYFLAAARFEHVGKAAQSVAISASAISSAIAALEEELGCPLFRREGKSIALNDQGKYLRAEAEAVFDHLSTIRKNLTGAAAAVQGSYRLAASHFLATRFLARAWTRLQRDHPKLEGELCSMATAIAIQEVIRGTLDLALVFSPLRHPELREVTLFEGQLILVVRPGHPVLREPAKTRLRALSAYPATLHKAGSGAEICEVHPMFDRFGIAPQIRCLYENDDQAVESVLNTDSWAMVPDVVAPTARSTLTVLSLPTGWHAPYTIAAITRPHRAENQTLLLLIEALRDLLDATRPRHR